MKDQFPPVVVEALRSGLRCRLCGGDTQVIDSRDAPGWSIRRRRRCVRCNERFTTYETIERTSQKPLDWTI